MSGQVWCGCSSPLRHGTDAQRFPAWLGVVLLGLSAFSWGRLALSWGYGVGVSVSVMVASVAVLQLISTGGLWSGSDPKLATAGGGRTGAAEMECYPGLGPGRYLFAAQYLAALMSLAAAERA